MSKETISRITDKVIEEVNELAVRPLDQTYAAIFIDAIVVKDRDGQVANRLFYAAIGGVDSDAVRHWRSRFTAEGVDGVGKIAKGRGRKPSLPAGAVEEVLRLTPEELPADGSRQWSTRTMAARVGIGKDSVGKLWADHHLKPWKGETFKVSNDPRFEENSSMSLGCT